MKIKRIMAGVLGCLLALAAFAGCNGGTGGGPVVPPGGGDGGGGVPEANGGRLNVFVNQQGYGRDWLDAIANQFTQLFGTEVLIVADSVNTTGTDAIANETNQYDLVFSGQSLVRYVSEGKILNINDVMNTKPSGEDKTVAQKLSASRLDDFFLFGSNYYMMPWETSFAGLHYNKNVLDDIFPESEGGWEEPVTTDEFVKLLDDIVEAEKDEPAETRAYGVIVAPELNYWSYMVETWWAQYEGYDGFYDYYYAEYYDGAEKKVATDEAGYRRALDATGRLRALEVLEDVLNQNTGHVNPVSEGIGYVDHQKQLASGKYQTNTNPSAFISCGDWYEKETYSAVVENGQPVRFMRTPVISSITEQLEDKKMTDETLAAVIRAIDDGATSYTGVSANDFARISEARLMVSCGTLNHAVAIPKNARNVDNAKAFLVFMASDLGQALFAQANGGRTQPYGYDPSTDASIVVSEYTKSVNAAYGKEFLTVFMDYRSPLVTFGGLSNYGDGNSLDVTFWKGTSSASSYHQNAVNYEVSRYSQVKNYISATVRS